MKRIAVLPGKYYLYLPTKRYDNSVHVAVRCFALLFFFFFFFFLPSIPYLLQSALDFGKKTTRECAAFHERGAISVPYIN